jgi:transposase InsO family protein
MAAEARTTLDTVIHSDHGTQFTAWAFTENVRRLGLLSSMGTVGDCYDNAPMESFWVPCRSSSSTASAGRPVSNCQPQSLTTSAFTTPIVVTARSAT